MSNFYSIDEKTGLKYYDCFQETPNVKEAIRRLPPHVYDERLYRMSRAIHQSMLKRELPKDQWTKYEDVRYFVNELIS